MQFLLPGQAMMTPNMQGVIMAIGKSSSVYEKNGPEAAFFKVLSFAHLLHSLSTHFHLFPCKSVRLSSPVYVCTFQWLLIEIQSDSIVIVILIIIIIYFIYQGFFLTSPVS